MGLLSACSPGGVLTLNDRESPNQNTPQKTENTPKSDGIGAPVALPPSYDREPPKPGQTQTQYMPNGLPALKPMKGVNVEALFAENIENTDKRFNRVENAVVDLRKEFEAYKPSIVRLAAVESDIQNLIKELEVLLQETPANQQAAQAPTQLTQQTDNSGRSEEPSLNVEQLEPQPTPPDTTKTPRVAQSSPPPQQVAQKIAKNEATQKPKAQATPKTPPAPMKTYEGVVAQNLRVGEHAGKVRLVLDTNQKTPFTVDLDNTERLIIIEMPEARWVGSSTKRFDDMKLIDAYTVEPINDGQGSMVVISLKKATSIMRERRLTPDSTSPYHRIYFDLKL